MNKFQLEINGKRRSMLVMFMIKEDDNNILPFGY
jgi:hypothetical protein